MFIGGKVPAATWPIDASVAQLFGPIGPTRLCMFVTFGSFCLQFDACPKSDTSIHLQHIIFTQITHMFLLRLL